MSVSARLGILFLAPALIFVTLFFFAPVVLTGVFSFTNMSTATGITGGAYQVTSNVLRQLADEGFEKSTLDRLGAKSYVVSAQALVVATTEGVVDKAVLVELESKHLGKTYQSRRDFERFLKKLKNRPRSTRDLKKISPYFRASLMGQRFESEEVLFAMLASLDLGLPDPQMRHVARASYTGWVWGTGNFKRMFSLGDNLRVLRNTGIYVVATLLLFNTGFALVLPLPRFTCRVAIPLSSGDSGCCHGSRHRCCMCFCGSGSLGTLALLTRSSPISISSRETGCSTRVRMPGYLWS